MMRKSNHITKSLGGPRRKWEPLCQTCRLPWTKHLGIEATCGKLLIAKMVLEKIVATPNPGDTHKLARQALQEIAR